MEYLIQLGTLFSIYAIVIISLNLLAGYTGMFSLTQAAFFGFGSYSTSILTTYYGINFFSTVLVGVIISLVLSLLISYILNEFKNGLFLIITFFINVIIFGVVQNWDVLTRGPFGISGVPRPSLFGLDFTTNVNFFILSLIFLVFVFLISLFVTESPYGRVLKSIREDEKRISVFGYKTGPYKSFIFMLCAVLTTISGSLFVSYNSFNDPYFLEVNESIFLLEVVIIGGLGSLSGSLLGTLIMLVSIDYFRFLGLSNDDSLHLQQLLFSSFVVILMLFKPSGLLGKYNP